MMTRKLNPAFCLVLICCAAWVARATAASISTDKSDYAPGETVRITGEGFAPDSEVTLQVLHSADHGGLNQTGAGHEPFTATTKSDGTFLAQWFVNPDDSSGEKLILTADDANGNHGEATFTDGP